MSQLAPETPTLETLEHMFPMSTAAMIAVSERRDQLNALLSGEKPGLLAIAGPCAMTLDRLIIDGEGDRLAALQRRLGGLITLHRIPPWKPRTNPDYWHGLETEEDTTVQAYQTVYERAALTANVAIEIGHRTHIDRYGKALTFGWIGGRNINNDDLVRDVSLKLPEVALGIKNGLDGSIDRALAQVELVRELRGSGGAPVVLIYRGGSNAMTPEAWEQQYLRAMKLTGGMMIVDPAHGSEMAHDPSGANEKSVAGQEAALEHTISLAETGQALPLGIIMEATEAVSPTDPVSPFDVAINGIKRLHRIKTQSTSV